MINLKEHTLELQKLENSAADKVGCRFLLLDEAELLGKARSKAIDEFTGQVLADMSDEIKASAELGRRLGEAFRGR